MVGNSLSPGQLFGNLVAFIMPISFAVLIVIVRKYPNVDMIPAQFTAGICAAIIGYFVAEGDSLRIADNAVNCAKSMNTVIQKGINPILNQYDYPDLMVKIGVDFGQNIVVRYGADEINSHVDLMGPAMNIAAKIQNMAKPKNR